MFRSEEGPTESLTYLKRLILYPHILIRVCLWSLLLLGIIRLKGKMVLRAVLYQAPLGCLLLCQAWCLGYKEEGDSSPALSWFVTAHPLPQKDVCPEGVEEDSVC